MESKFTHLLQPIRDLAANWDVNVAEELEDYLEELENIHFSLEQEGGLAGFNFAEAALLIQGSASVYGKKVEYLHSLVYAALEAIAEKRAHRGRDGEAPGGSDSDIEADEQFLTLDDIAEGGPEIDLLETSPAAAPVSLRPPVSLCLLGHCQGPMSTSKYQSREKKQHEQKSALHCKRVCKVQAVIAPVEELFTDSSGAILLDPGDAVTQEALCSSGGYHCQAITSPAAPDQHTGNYQNDFMDDDHCYSPVLEGCNAPGDSRNTPTTAPCEEEEVEDPYYPLDLHQPGILPQLPFKYRLPSKRARPKTTATATEFARLVTVAPIGKLAMAEFEGYLLQMQSAARRQSRASRQLSAIQEENCFDEEDATDPCYDNDEADDGAQPGEEQHFEYDADMPAFTELSLSTGLPFQEQPTLLEEQECHKEEAWVTQELVERVREWQKSIQPHLEVQDSRPSFDIHGYGNRIVQRVRSKVSEAEWTCFGVAVEGEQPWEICRLFASMLQLVNAGSLRILKAS